MKKRHKKIQPTFVEYITSDVFQTKQSTTQFKELYRKMKIVAIGFLVQCVVAFLLFGTARAADLSKPPRLETKEVELLESNARRSFGYLGLYGGTDTNDAIAGVAVGYEPFRYFRGEVQYDHIFGRDLDLLAFNGILQVPGRLVTPYILGGIGYYWTSTDNDLALLAGGGLRVQLNPSVELDVRYRHLFDVDADMLTAGINLRF